MNLTVEAKTSLPGAAAIQAAIQSQRELAGYVSNGLETQRIQILDANDVAHTVELPTSALQLLIDVLGELADGNAVKIVPIHAELTTQEAADLLNVSRPHLVKLLETDAIPFHRTGKHRRVKFEALMDYKEQRQAQSERALEELARQAQELGLGYE